MELIVMEESKLKNIISSLLQDVLDANNKSIAKPKPKYIGIKEAREMLSISDSTIRRHITSGNIKAIKVGGQIRIKLDDINSYMEEYKSNRYRR